MSIVKLTVNQIKDLGLWNKVCEYKGWHPNNGKSGNDVVEFDTTFDTKLTENHIAALEKIQLLLNQLYIVYFNDLSPEARFKIENGKDIPFKSFINTALYAVCDVLEKIKK